jgi:cysteinyl-tRNA synthetase
MSDDLNTPKAAAALFGLLKAATPHLVDWGAYDRAWDMANDAVDDAACDRGAAVQDAAAASPPTPLLSPSSGAASAVGAAAVVEALTCFNDALGLFYDVPHAYFAPKQRFKAAGVGFGRSAATAAAAQEEVAGLAGSSKPSAEVLGLVAARKEAKAAKDWQRADALRAQVAARGWDLADGKDGGALLSPREQDHPLEKEQENI